MGLRRRVSLRRAAPVTARTHTPRPGPRSAAVVYVRLTDEERREVAEAAKRDALPVGVWARSRLLLAAREQPRKRGAP